MFNYPNKLKIDLLILISVLFIWVILTEFIFVSNNIFPSPSLVILAYIDLFSNYNFLINFVSTFTVVYLSFFISLLVIKIKFPFLSYKSDYIKYLIQILKYFLFIPELLLAALLIYWFGGSFIVKLVFGILINAFLVYKVIVSFDENKIKAHIESIKSLGVSDFNIYKNIIWKFIEPELFDSFIKKQSVIWSSIITFEFIQNYDGIGMVVRQALEFNDLSIIVSIIILITFIVFVLDKILRFVKNKYFFWE